MPVSPLLPLSDGLQIVHSASGVKITLGHGVTPGLSIETPGGHRVSLDDPSGTVVIADNSGNTIRLSSSGIQIESASAISLTAPTVSINASNTTVSGVFQAETVITNTVIANTYSPGAGNLW